MAWAWSVAAVLAGYLVGSLSFAVIVSRAMGLADPRSYGSGNPGATNVLRSGKRSAAVLTLALDALKGYAPVLAALWLAPRLGWGAAVAPRSRRHREIARRSDKSQLLTSEREA